jgi:dephospho-CoA kinase
MKIIGLTGGIGSGKSTIARVFRSMGTPIYTADDRAKALYTESAELKAAVMDRFGNEVYPDDRFVPAVLAEKVFKDEKALADLNAMVHPLVKGDFSSWIGNQDAPYIIREAAILFESGSHLDCHEVITVEANEEERIRRVMKRDGVSEEQVRRRMDKQWSDPERAALASHVIINNPKSLVLKRCYDLHEYFVELQEAPSF